MLILIAVKALVLFILSKIFKLSLDQGLLFSIALAQGGEFAFVMKQFIAEKPELWNEDIGV